MQTPTAGELYGSILRKMKQEGRTDGEIRLVASYLSGATPQAAREYKTTTAVSWKRVRAIKEVKVAREDHNDKERDFYHHMFTLESVLENVAGTFEVTIDVEEIVRQLARRAANTISGKATAYGRLIRARKLSEQIVDSKTTTHPLPKGYIILAEVRR